MLFLNLAENFTLIYHKNKDVITQKLHLYFQSTEIKNDNVLKRVNKQHYKGIRKGEENFKKYKENDRSQKCLNDKTEICFNC